MYITDLDIFTTDDGNVKLILSNTQSIDKRINIVSIDIDLTVEQTKELIDTLQESIRIIEEDHVKDQ